MTTKNITARTPKVTKESNQQALDKLLTEMEGASGRITRDKGTRFETLIKDWLTKEPTYKDLFTEVLTYKQWTLKYPGYTTTSRDIGIDLVAVNANGNGFTAIQCKLYGKDAIVPKVFST